MSVEDFRQKTRINGRSVEQHIACLVEARPAEFVIEGQLIRAGEAVEITLPESRAFRLDQLVIDKKKLEAAQDFLTRKKADPDEPTPTVDSCYYELWGECIPPLFSAKILHQTAPPMRAEDAEIMRLKALVESLSAQAESAHKSGKKGD